ncbi:hypothetical protein EVJ58_g4777, partial [Rhodofomes roseus]
IYALISTFEDCPAGIPRLVCGGDVTYDVPPTIKKLTTAAIRGAVEGPESRVLHRIILNIVGEPLWRYTDELQLLCAFRDIVQVHQYLYEKGILHRDISPGNLFLWVGSAEAAGFLSDLDMARVDESALGYQGTLQFMARQLLEAMDKNKPIEHTVAHDLESIGYVFGYSILRRLLTIPRCPGELAKVFKQIFGAMLVGAVAMQRRDRQPLSWIVEVGDDVTSNFIQQHLSAPVVNVMKALELAIQAAHEAHRDNRLLRLYPQVRWRSGPINAVCTHAFLLDVLNEAIEKLKQNPSSMKRFEPASL